MPLAAEFEVERDEVVALAGQRGFGAVAVAKGLDGHRAAHRSQVTSWSRVGGSSSTTAMRTAMPPWYGRAGVAAPRKKASEVGMACSWGSGLPDSGLTRNATSGGATWTAPKPSPRPSRATARRAARWFTTGPAPAAPRGVPLAVLAALGVGVHWLSNQRVEIPRGEQLLRRNTWTDGVDVLPEGSAWVLPGVHTARQLPARDLTLRATRLASHSPQALQTVEGLSVAWRNLRVALDARQLPQLAPQTARANWC